MRMKKQLLTTSIAGILALGLFAMPVSFAQTNDQRVEDARSLWSSDRWYINYDGDDVRVVEIDGETVTFEIPAMETVDGYFVDDYYIVRWPDDYQNVLIDDDLEIFRDSFDYLDDHGEEMYEIDLDDQTLSLRVDQLVDRSMTFYIYVFPQDDNNDDYRGAPLIFDAFALKDLRVSPARETWGSSNQTSDLYDAWSNKRVDNVSCVWDNTRARVTLFWEKNQAYSDASKVEVSYRPNDSQWSMTVVGEPSIDDERIVVDTAHREIQLFRLKPIDRDGAMVGTEIQYICKPSNVTSPGEVDKENPIPVVPETWPKETTAIVLIVAALGYAIYRKTKKAY